MLTTEIKQLIKRELPAMFREDRDIHEFILNLTRNQYADKRETESRFDRVLDELRRDREDQNRKWEAREQERKKEWEIHQQEHRSEWEAHQQERKNEWEAHQQEHKKEREEQDRKWDEHQKTIEHVLSTLDAFAKKYQSDIGAIGSRWGFQSEEAFRGALKGILEQSFGVEELNVNDFDESGEVFGRPDQVELDVIIKNGLLIVCELKSSMSRGDVYIFDRKVKFYERLHQRAATRRLIITPMMRDDARRTAAELGIEVFSYAQDAAL
ncbi:hypothetical protein U14_00229 [Candidatus Moduliflexus flocculans]|uniref:DUF3782 domain-containing protein n=1 Tax=Candidatus Moduliflexus flocculans TaxID=1499966 RepID=A0A0S6VV06_9BACT|nr:hypothetical protein U14_00229 [Candidatus Moduliflexus flocculans]